MNRDPYFGSTGERRYPGHKRWQTFLRDKVDIFSGPGVMAADQARCFGGDVDGLQQQSAAGGGKVLRLGGVEISGLRVRLCGCGSDMGDVDTDTQRAHNIHPNQYRGDSRPMMTMKLALPLASPHCRLRCWVFPAIWGGLPGAPWTTPSKGFKGPHWVRYCHHTENPMQVTEEPVSTRPRTGIPSRLSWPVMGGPTAHPIGVTLASGDPSNSLTARLGWSGSRPLEAAAPVFVLEAGRGRWRMHAGEGGVGGPGGAGQLDTKWPSSLQRKQVFGEGGRMEAPLCSPGRYGERGWEEAVERWQRLLLLKRRQRPWRLHAGRGFVSGDLLVGFLKVFLEDPDLILHCFEHALHLGVRLFF